MNIDDMTLGDIKKIAALAAGLGITQTAAPTSKAHPFVGRYVICRTYGAGVHAGILVSQDENGGTILREARRLWRWRSAAKAVALSGVATSGLAGTDVKIDVLVPEVSLTLAIETIPCTPEAEKSIREWAV